MNYYLLLVVMVLVTAFIFQGYREKNLKYVIVACLLLYAIYGLRNTYVIGDDVRTSYLANFRKMETMSWDEIISYTEGRNALFYFMTKAFAVYISTDYQLYISVIAAFVTICFGWMIYKYSPNPLQSILYHFGLLYFTFHFSALKQSIAMAFLMLAFDAIIEKKPIKFIVIVLLAGQIHFPAMIFLPAYWIAKIKPGRAYLLLLVGLLVLTYVFRNEIINFLMKYYKDEEASIDLSDVNFLRTKALIMIVIVTAAVVFRVPTAEDRVYVILLQLCAMAIVFQTFCGYNNIFERLADYYFQFSVIFIPMVFDKNAKRRSLINWRLLQAADTIAPYLFCGFGVYRFLNAVKGDWHLYPFKFFFQ